MRILLEYNPSLRANIERGVKNSTDKSKEKILDEEVKVRK
jgi:hypothetical protein